MAAKELREIQKELGIKSEFKKREKVEKKEAVKNNDDTKEDSEDKPTVGEWSTVESSVEPTPTVTESEVQERTSIKVSRPAKKQSAADLEVKNWDISTKKQIDTSLSDSDEEQKPKATLFKKRKIKQ